MAYGYFRFLAVLDFLPGHAWPPSAHVYFGRHYLDFGVRVEDGFVDPGRLTGVHCLPTAAELSRMPFGKGAREVLVVDARVDERLRDCIARAKALARSYTDARDRFKLLAALASDELGGVSGRIGSDSARHLAALMAAADSALVPLGDVEYGVCRHRALRFKVLCDAVGLDCRLVRGNFGGEVGGGHET
jgi:hypothetical protein